MKTSWFPAILALSVALSGTPRVAAQATETPPASEPPAALPPVTSSLSGTTNPAGSGGRAQGPDPVEVAADALVVRPLGLAATVIGAAVFVVALPFAAISKDVDRTGRALVGGPANFTFKRRLGDFEDSALR